MSKKDDEFWEKEARMRAHRENRAAYRGAWIDAMFTQPCEREDCQTHHDEPCPGCGRRWTRPKEGEDE